MAEATAKHCAKCNEKKKADEFHRSKTGCGGLHGYCKLCQHDHYVERKKRLAEKGLCISCARAEVEFMTTRCTTCRLRQKVDEQLRRKAKRGIPHDLIGQGHPVGVGIGPTGH